MSHKANPRSLRLPITEMWDARWFVRPSRVGDTLKEDVAVRKFLAKKLVDALVDSIVIERNAREISLTIFAAKPGFIIGRGGKGIEDLQRQLERSVFKMKRKVRIQVQEIKNPTLSAAVVAQNMRNDILKRMPFRRVMKQTIERVMKAGAQGVKVNMAGRLNGVEIAREETLAAGKVPLQTLRSTIDYALEQAFTTYGAIGIKVWIYKGETFERHDKLHDVKTDRRSPTL